MKFFTPVLALVATSTVFSKSILIKRDDYKVIESAFDNVSESCQKDFLPYVKCIERPKLTTYENDCKELQSDECKKFAENPLSLLPNCKNDHVIIESFSSNASKAMFLALNYLCAKDEAGNACPIPKYILNNGMKNINVIDINIPEEKKIVDSSCESASCRDASYNMYKAVLESMDDLENLSTTSGTFDDNTIAIDKAFIEHLDSNECKAMIKSGNINNNNATTNTGAVASNEAANNGTTINNNGAANNNTISGATTLKISTGLFASLGLLLLTLY